MGVFFLDYALGPGFLYHNSCARNKPMLDAGYPDTIGTSIQNPVRLVGIRLVGLPILRWNRGTGRDGGASLDKG